MHGTIQVSTIESGAVGSRPGSDGEGNQDIRLQPFSI